MIKDTLVVASALATWLYSVKHLNKLLKDKGVTEIDYQKEELKYRYSPQIAFVISSLLLYSPEIYKSVALKEFKKLLCISGVSTLLIAASTKLYTQCETSIHDKFHKNKKSDEEIICNVTIGLNSLVIIAASCATLAASHAIAARF